MATDRRITVDPTDRAIIERAARAIATVTVPGADWRAFTSDALAVLWALADGDTP